jgi:hypothetical protein
MNTEYLHAGNADQLRALQFDASARCNLCHYPSGYRSVDGESVTVLEPVQIMPGHFLLFCQKCVQVCTDLGDTEYKVAASIIRPLPPESQAANASLIATLQKGYMQIGEPGKASLTLELEDGTTRHYKGGNLFIKRKEKDGK